VTARTYAAARRIAREYALRGDIQEARRVLSNLLWHVDREDGGFIGLSEDEFDEYCELNRGGIDRDVALAAMYAPMRWPEDALPSPDWSAIGPEMLAVLESLVLGLQDMRERGVIDESDDDQWLDERLAQARAIIAKATGDKA
jgi:hypothetical protein